MSEEEIWKVYPDYDFIEVSNLGKVRTKDRVVTRGNGRKYHAKGRVLKQHVNGHGYMYVSFGVNGKVVYLRVHRMVATCYIPNPNNLPEVNHKDCDKTNNAASNLEWCNHQENIAYREKYGVSAKEYTKVLRKTVIAVNQKTSEVFWFESQSEAACQLGVSVGNVNDVIKGRYNKTHDFWFCYADENVVEKTREKFGDDIAEKVEKLINENKKF